jgi:hypothetical protein
MPQRNPTYHPTSLSSGKSESGRGWWWATLGGGGGAGRDAWGRMSDCIVGWVVLVRTYYTSAFISLEYVHTRSRFMDLVF